ncbi:MAG: amino acid adenylation domain-containing protein, partial [Methylococcales bacterium]|nr:amino acid adenylation domain-containing protein [Methylococcales bacterium]
EPLHHLVQSAIDQAGNSIAVLDEQGQLTYAELATKSDAIAGYLLDKGVQQGDRVAVCLPRSCMMPVVMLAVLKCGAGYVPVDPDYPEQRVQYMLEDCGACLVVTAEDLSVFESLPKLTVELPTVVMTDLAYMIYTSGSTGNPKGVQLSHHSIVNHMLWMQSTFPLTVDGRVLQKTPYSFDASVWEFWSPLIQAKTLVMAKPNGHKDPAYLCEATTQHQITVLQVVPALLQVLVQQPGFASCTSLQQIFCGGELLPQSLVREVALVLPKVQLVNLYGPTEATIDSTYHVTDSSYDRDSVPIGLPITGASVYALDPQGQPVPEGVVGELMIAGDGLAIGYHQREALTAEAFYEQNTIGQRVYQTGDLVRWVKTSAHAGLSSMVLEYVARRDSQVKLRGYRIELGEIESAIQAHADVQQVTVQVIEAAMGDQRLVSYVVGSDDFAVIEQSIAQQLPDYMLPNHWQALTELPLTPSGKIDVTALPAPNVAAVEYVAAESDIEQQLVLIWQGHLGIEKVSVIGDFFAMGGHSLLAVKMVSAIEKVAGRTVPIAALFQCPSVRGMAQWLDKPQYESPLLVLNEAADLPWIFCIHPVGGQAILFRHLSEQLNRQWSVAGLESIGLANDEAPLLTISEMASRYLTAMRSLQSTGPYTVLGYSMGGVIAYEMARQCMPDERIHLILLDTETPTFATEFDAKDAGFLREMIQSFEVQSGIEIPEEAAEALLTGFDLDQMDTVLSVEEIEDLVEQLMEAMGMDDDGDEMQG